MASITKSKGRLKNSSRLSSVTKSSISVTSHCGLIWAMRSRKAVTFALPKSSVKACNWRLTLATKSSQRSTYPLAESKERERIYQKGDLSLEIAEKILKSDVEKYIEADDAWLKIKEVVQNQFALVELIENMLENIKQRGFAIKHAIEYKKFEAGL